LDGKRKAKAGLQSSSDRMDSGFPIIDSVSYDSRVLDSRLAFKGVDTDPLYELFPDSHLNHTVEWIDI
jgi:hypothetical protein